MSEPGSVSIEKILTRNDTGETGGHQWGMCVPKQPAFLGFFPELDPGEKNPRVDIPFFESDGREWDLCFIHYNNKLHDPRGTRNEFRLTRLIPFIRERNLREGDIVVLRRDASGRYRIDSRRKATAESADGVLRLSGKWRIVRV